MITEKMAEQADDLSKRKENMNNDLINQANNVYSKLLTLFTDAYVKYAEDHSFEIRDYLADDPPEDDDVLYEVINLVRLINKANDLVRGMEDMFMPENIIYQAKDVFILLTRSFIVKYIETFKANIPHYLEFIVTYKDNPNVLMGNIDIINLAVLTTKAGEIWKELVSKGENS